MKLKFKDRCTDKYTGEMYDKEQIKEFEDERAKEILKTGYAEEAEENIAYDEEKVSKTHENSSETQEDEATKYLKAKSLQELRKICKALNLDTTGKRKELTERLYNYYPF